MKIKPVLYTFFGLVCLSLLTPLVVDRNYLFPFILPRALFLRIMLDLALPFYLYLILAKKEWRPNLKNPLNLSLLVFLAIYYITSFTGVNVLRSVWGNIERMGGAWYMMHLVLLYFYVLLLAQAGGKWILRLLKFFLLISIISVGYGLWVYMGLPGFFADPSLPDRVSSTFGNPIFFASFLVLPLFLTAFFALREESRGWKIVYLVMALLQLLGIYQSATRGAFVGLVIGVFFGAFLYLFKAESKRLHNYGLGTVGAIVLVTGLLFVFGEKLPQGSFLYRITHLKDNNSSARLIQWKTALEGYKDHPALGVGPENYYIIANKYYNPELNQYDPSWFDKPHNYLLEILVTTGAAGFLAYAAVLAFFALALWKAYKVGLLDWLETCLLLAGMIVYQVQNFFVFDTISASVAFFMYLAFGGYLWYEAGLAEKKDTVRQTKGDGLQPAFVYTVFGLSAVATIYAIYTTGIVPGRVAKNINYGYAYSSVNPQMSVQFFEKARSQPFVFDPGELASRYEESASNYITASSQSTKVTKEFVDDALGKVAQSLEDAVAKVNNYPIYWYKLGEAYALKSNFDGTGLNPRAVEAANKAVELAPKRLEPLFFLGQVQAYQGNLNAALATTQKTIEMYPWNPDAKWRLSVIYRLAGKQQEAVDAAEAAMKSGYKLTQVNDMEWLAKYYYDKKDYARMIDLYQQVIAANPDNYQLYAELAKVYAEAGDKGKAIETANMVVKINPAAKADVDAFLESLGN